MTRAAAGEEERSRSASMHSTMHTGGSAIELMKQTLDQSGTVVGQILEYDIPAPVSEESEQGSHVELLGHGISDLDDAPSAATKQLDAIAAGIAQEEPGSGRPVSEGRRGEGWR